MNDLSFPPPSGRGGDPAQPSSNDPFHVRKSLSELRRRRRQKVREQKKAKPREPYFLPLALQAGFACAMLLLAVWTLLTDHSVEGKLKALLIAGGGALASYLINTLAIHQGARQWAYGFHVVGVFSVLAIGFTGGALFAATASGLTLKDVAGVVLIERGQVQAHVVSSRIESARRVERYVAAASSISADLSRFVACEESDACISGKRAGRGAVTKTLELLSTRADQLVSQLKAGQATGSAALASINGLLASYQTTITSGDDVWVRWGAASLIDAKIGQSLATVEESLPISAVHAYAGELEAGAVIDGNPGATTRITQILQGHGKRLREVDVGGAERAALPPFPPRPGVTTALSYGLMFLPILALCFVTDLAIPLSLFLLRYTQERREIEEEFGRYPNDDDPTPPDGSGRTLEVWPDAKLFDGRHLE